MKKVFLAIIFFCALIFSIEFFKIGRTTTYWKGHVRIPDQTFEIIITVENTLFGRTAGKISSPGQFVLNYPISHCTQKGDSLKFEITENSPPTSFRGKINKTGISGHWIQGEKKTLVSLAKTDRKTVLQAEANVMVNYARQFSINKRKVNWDSLEAFKYFSIAKTEPDSALIIVGQKLLELLNDNHGGVIYKGDYIKNPNAPKIRRTGKAKLLTYFYLFKMSPQMLESDVAYIRIPTLAGQSKEEIDQIISKIQRAICGLNYTLKTNWIIDLRLNNGGNFPGMIAGIGNIAGDGLLGYVTKDSDKPDEKMFLKNGHFYQNDRLMARSSMHCAISGYKPKIAVIIGAGTNSAAEDICIALKGRPDTRFFGEKTKGSVSGNSILFINETTSFNVGTSYYKDRTEKIYQEGIDPDVHIADEDDFYDLKNDKKIIAALKWLKISH